MKKLKLVALTLSLVAACGLTAGGLTACDPNKPDTPIGGTESEYTLKITAIGSTTIQVSKQVTLRTTVTGTNEKDVTWESLNPDVATVTDRGVVTGVKEGKATIKAVLVADTNCTATISITVEPAVAPESLTVSGYSQDKTGWVGETTKLSLNVYPENADTTVDWTSSDSSIAEVSGEGLVTYKSKGEVTITATSKADSTKSDSVTLNVRKGIFYTNIGSPNWDYSHQDDEDSPYIEISDSDASLSAGYNTAYFAGYKGTKFYAEATFKVYSLTENTWDWQGFGLGSGLSDSDARFFTYSPHSPISANNFNKIILRDRPESWGALTNRSQMWGGRGLDDISLDDEVKISMIRDGNDYYYFLNDVMYYFDVNTTYNGIETMPFVCTFDIPVKVTDIRLVTDASEIDEMLASPECQKSFFAWNGNVEYTSDSDFTFKNVNASSRNDQEAHSIGDKAMVMQNFEIEFDIDNLAFGGANVPFKGVAINLSRYENADTVDTFGVGYSKDGGNENILGKFFTWNYPSGMANSVRSDWYETSQTVLENPTDKHHVKLIRTIDSDTQKSYFRIFIDGEEYVFDAARKDASDGAVTNYTGAYLIWVSGEYASYHVSNFTFKYSADSSEMPDLLTLTSEKSSIEVNDTLQLTPALASGAQAAVTYTSMNAEVATVSESGLVTAVAPGTVTVVATYSAGNLTVKAVKTLTVEELPEITITNTETEIWPGDTLQITYTLSKDSAHTFVYSSSDDTVATVSATGLVTPAGDGQVVITVKDSLNDDVKATITLDIITSLKVQITNTLPYVEINDTLQITHRFSYNDGHTVSYASSNTAIATISETGLITPVALGKFTVTVTCKEDGAIKAEKEFEVVNPLSLEITNQETELWLTGKLQITHAFSYNAGHEVSYITSDSSVATISESGLIAAVGTGNVTITVADKSSDLTDEIVLTVNDILFDHTYQADKWDYSGLASATPVLETAGDEIGGYRPVAIFKNVSGNRYYAEVTVKINEYGSGAGVWAGISLGNVKLNGEDFIGMLLSAVPDSRPIIVKQDIDTWGQPLDENSQVWNWSGFRSTLNNNAIKLGLVRDGNNYLYYVNDVLVWVDGSSTWNNGANSVPAVRFNEVFGVVTNMYATTDTNVINEKLGLGSADKFVALNENVEVKTDGSIEFKNAGITSIDNGNHVIKDYAAISKGGLKLDGGKDAKVEFDIVITGYGAGDNGLLGMSLRSGAANEYKETRSFLVGKTQFGFSGWAFNSGMGNSAIGAPSDIPEGLDMSEGTTHHVVVERITDVGYRLTIDNVAVATWGYDNYSADMYISFTGTTVAGTISNIAITYPED